MDARLPNYSQPFGSGGIRSSLQIGGTGRWNDPNSNPIAGGRSTPATPTANRAELLKTGSAGDPEPRRGPDRIEGIHQRRQQGPAGGGIQPPQTDQLVGAAEDLHIPHHFAAGFKGMDAAHRLPVADAAVGGWVVAGGIDIHERQPRNTRMDPPVTLLKKANLPHAEGTAAVEKDRELSHSATLGRRAAPLRGPNQAKPRHLQLLQFHRRHA